KPVYAFLLLTLVTAAGVPMIGHAMGQKPEKSVIKEATSSPIPPGAPASFADIADKLLPAVVNISSTAKVEDNPLTEETPEGMDDLQEMPFGSPEEFLEKFLNRRGGETPAIPESSLGSGFVINAEKGYIVTNNHVVK